MGFIEAGLTCPHLFDFIHEQGHSFFKLHTFPEWLSAILPTLIPTFNRLQESLALAKS